MHRQQEAIHLARDPNTAAVLRRDGRARGKPFNCERRLEIYLASCEDVVGKAGRPIGPKGSTKAVRATAEGWAAAIPPPAATDADGTSSTGSPGRPGRDGGMGGGGGSIGASPHAGTLGGRGRGSARRGSRPGGSPVAAQAGAGAPLADLADDGGSYGASSSTGAGVRPGRGARPAGRGGNKPGSSSSDGSPAPNAGVWSSASDSFGCLGRRPQILPGEVRACKCNV